MTTVNMHQKRISIKRVFRASCKKATRTQSIEPHSYRNEFQRDRDRILYSKEFRRLSGKTQIFVAGFDDHMRTRLTHTLEVAQLADTISRALGLDDVLTEAIAYGHDVGHTPFGHVGERTLNFIMNGCTNYYNYNNVKEFKPNSRGFKHNLQSIRVVTELENSYRNDCGLNLTRYTLWGIKNHTKTYYEKQKCEYYQEENCMYKNSGAKCVCEDGQLSVDFYDESSFLHKKCHDALIDERDWTFEAHVVAYADEIAQRHHDIEDGLFAGIIDAKDLAKEVEKAFSNILCDTDKQKLSNISSSQNPKGSDILSNISRILINLYITHYIYEMRLLFETLMKAFEIKNNRDFQNHHSDVYHFLTKDDQKINDIAIGNKFIKSDNAIKRYLKDTILLSELAQRMDGKASYIIRQLIKAYLTNPQQLPNKTIVSIWQDYLYASGEDINKDYKEISTAMLASNARKGMAEALKIKNEKPGDGKVDISQILLRKVCDHIAGMTDNYAYLQYESLYGTHPHKRNKM